MAVKINIPSSKSYAQRAIVAALLADSRSVIEGVDVGGDIQSAVDVARWLGANVQIEGRRIIIDGIGGLRGGVINVGESGLLARIFSMLGAVSEQGVRVQGQDTLLKRPMSSTLKALDALGASYNIVDNRLPLTIEPLRVEVESITIDSSEGSQTLTGLLFALPLMQRPPKIIVKNLKSKPYIDITLDVLRWFGIDYHCNDYREFTLMSNRGYISTKVEIEADWSSAGYFLVAGYIYGVDVDIVELNGNSLQGDRAIVDAIEEVKRSGKLEFDATDTPDLFPALVALCATLPSVSRLRGICRLRDKESDRGEVLRTEFLKLGIKIDIDYPNDTMIVRGGTRILQQEVIDPCGDHRIAMATAIMGVDIKLMTPEVVDKSFRQFWQQWDVFKGALGVVEL